MRPTGAAPVAVLLAGLAVGAASALEQQPGRLETWPGRPSTSPRWTVYAPPPVTAQRPRRPLSAVPVPGLLPHRPEAGDPAGILPTDQASHAGWTLRAPPPSEIPRYRVDDGTAAAAGIDTPPPPMPTFAEPTYRREEPSKEPQPMELPAAGNRLQLPGAEPAQ